MFNRPPALFYKRGFLLVEQRKLFVNRFPFFGEYLNSLVAEFLCFFQC